MIIGAIPTWGQSLTLKYRVMKIATIKRVVSVEPNGIVGVELYGMRNDLSILFIDTKWLNWYSVYKNGYSVIHTLRNDVDIQYKDICVQTRRIRGVSFIND